jgi:hypothetical protein
MKYFTKISELADKFEKKVAQAEAPTTSQTGTTELFFDNENNQKAFNAAVQNPNSAVYKAMMAWYMKNQKPCGFNLKATANAGAGASWDLTVTPDSIKAGVMTGLDLEFQKLMKEKMAARLAKANAGAKAGGGSGTLDICSLDFSAES